jgi:hypothetical protein
MTYGTMTRRDVSHFDALANIFEALRCSDAEMDDIIAQMQFKPLQT